jgi:hypothetical protein
MVSESTGNAMKGVIVVTVMVLKSNGHGVRV